MSWVLPVTCSVWKLEADVHTAQSPSTRLISCPHRRPGGLVRSCGDGIQIDQDAGIVAPIRPGKRHQRPWGSVPSPRDLDLRAGKVELGLVRLHGHVQSNMLHAEQILAARGAGGDGDVDCGVRVCVCYYLGLGGIKLSIMRGAYFGWARSAACSCPWSASSSQS